MEPVEGRLETDLSRRESAVAATSSGPALLQEAFGKRSYGDARLSFSVRERGLERVEQRVDVELRTQEEALRALPPGRRYLSAAEQARAAGATGPPTLADRESMVRAATLQVEEEFDKLEEDLLAIAVGEDLLAEAAATLAGNGRTRSLGERWETCERVKSGIEEELDRREHVDRELRRRPDSTSLGGRCLPPHRRRTQPPRFGALVSSAPSAHLIPRHPEPDRPISRSARRRGTMRDPARSPKRRATRAPLADRPESPRAPAGSSDV